MGKGSRRFSVSTNLKPYVRRVVRHGKRQAEFARDIGIPMQSCLQGKGVMKKGGKPGREAIVQAMKDCSSTYKF